MGRGLIQDGRKIGVSWLFGRLRGRSRDNIRNDFGEVI